MSKIKKTLKIKQIKSGIGYNKKAKATLRALGLRKMNQVVIHKDSETIQGMVNQIPFLLEVEKHETWFFKTGSWFG